jgi:gamma-glutamyl:cysteine ligase YbdK (ATP-grasp superfamily)
MGQEISSLNFTPEDERLFNQKLRNETKILMSWFQNESFEDKETPMCGLEAESWIVDKNFLPNPVADKFLSGVNHPLVVPEISKFNYEINTDPMNMEGRFLSNYHASLRSLWQNCQNTASDLDSKSLLIGSLPTLRKYMLKLEYLYPNKRYFALNDSILKMRRNQEIVIDIKGKDELREVFTDVMLEAATTSLQIHLQVSQKDAKRFYNASILASSFVAAISANSPFLFGKTLWSETRIPIFEQSIHLDSYTRAEGRNARRVTLGGGYIRESMFELFLNNLDGYPVLLPDNLDDDPNWLSHVRLHNGSIWRWNRPILGINKNGKPHLRIEHRVPAAGPTIGDMIANLAFYLGTVHYLAGEELESVIPFEKARHNFYQACEKGFNAEIHWRRGTGNLQKILRDEILPRGKEALKNIGVSSNDLDYYFDDILMPRALKGQNGSNWQRAFINTNGPRFQELLELYYENQESDIPVHLWQA